MKDYEKLRSKFAPPFLSRFCMFCAYTRPRYQVSIYRTIGPLVLRMATNTEIGIQIFTDYLKIFKYSDNKSYFKRSTCIFLMTFMY